MAVINGVEIEEDNSLLDLPEVKEAPITPQTGIAAIALNFAMKYADIITVKDGALYQQYKLEGRNIQVLHLKEVFYYAEQIEKHLLETPSRLALAVLDAVSDDINEAMDAASGMEAAEAGETEGLDPEDDSPVGEAETPNA